MVNRCVDILQLSNCVAYFSDLDYYNYLNNPIECACVWDYVYYKKELRRPSAKTIMDAYIEEISILMKYFNKNYNGQSVPVDDYIVGKVIQSS
jgi:hypothetical protein